MAWGLGLCARGETDETDEREPRRESATRVATTPRRPVPDARRVAREPHHDVIEYCCHGILRSMRLPLQFALDHRFKVVRVLARTSQRLLGGGGLRRRRARCGGQEVVWVMWHLRVGLI